MSAALASAAIERRDRRFGWLMAAPGLLALLPGHPVPGPLGALHQRLRLHADRADPRRLRRASTTTARALGNAEFRHALWVTLLFVAAVVLLEFLLGFTVALMLNTVERGKNVYYLILLFPLLMNPVVVGPDLADVPASGARHRELPAEPRSASAR